MAWRVTNEEVRALIDTGDPNLSVAPFIDTANALTDYVAAQDTSSMLNAALLKEIEKYLAAYAYEFLDPQYTEKKTGDAEAKFQGEFGMGFDSNKWGQHAKRLDVTGTLDSLDRPKHKVSLAWLGLPPSEQTDYVDRD